MTLPKRLRFTAADADRAHAVWGANCGPGALAAVMGLTLAEVRPHMGDFAQKRYTNPTLMWESLKSLSARWHLNRGEPLALPDYGLARIQWEGPWTAPGVPIRARYRHTHWIGACRRGADNIGVFDINAMNSGGWIALADWSQTIVPWILKECVPRASGGWHITHSVELEVAA